MSETRQMILVACGVVLVLGLAIWIIERPGRLTGDVPQVLVYSPRGEGSGFVTREEALELASQGDGSAAVWAERNRPASGLFAPNSSVLVSSDLAGVTVDRGTTGTVEPLYTRNPEIVVLQGEVLEPLSPLGSTVEDTARAAAAATRTVAVATRETVVETTQSTSAAVSEVVRRTFNVSDDELRGLLTVEGFDLARLEAALEGRLTGADRWLVGPALRTAQSNPVVLRDTLAELRQRLGL